MNKTTTNKTERVEFRISEYDNLLLTYTSRMLGMTKSRYFKMLLDSTLTPLKLKIQKGEISLEDIKTDINYKL